MIERTFETLEAFLFLALLSFIYERVELLLLPSVAEWALLEPLASLLVAGNERAALPIFAEFGLIPE